MKPEVLDRVSVKGVVIPFGVTRGLGINLEYFAIRPENGLTNWREELMPSCIEIKKGEGVNEVKDSDDANFTRSEITSKNIYTEECHRSLGVVLSAKPDTERENISLMLRVAS